MDAPRGARRDRGPEREPDRRFAYRNSNYVVAAELAERAGGEDFGSLVDTLIARPLGLPGFSCARSVGGTRLATPHVALFGRAVDLLAVTGGRIPTDSFGPVWGDGGVASSARDLARFTEALFGGELVSAPMLGAMVARTSRFGRKRGYGLGVMTRREHGAVVAGHDGLYFGWSASSSIDDATATTVAVVTSLASPRVPASRRRGWRRRRAPRSARRAAPAGVTSRRAARGRPRPRAASCGSAASAGCPARSRPPRGRPPTS